MIKIYPYENLGRANHGWLDARHHFSFGSYNNPNRLNFGVLRVVNDDIIEAKKGFDTHPHKDMEIITYVRKGAITHKDSSGNEGRTEDGDVQVMSAGTGIYHSEFNLEDEETNLYQIWIEPNKTGVKPRWDAAKFPKENVKDALHLLVSQDREEGSLFIYQDAKIYGGNLARYTIINHLIKYQAYILVSKGEIELEGKVIKKGDGAEITDTNNIEIKAIKEAEILVIDVPKK